MEHLDLMEILGWLFHTNDPDAAYFEQQRLNVLYYYATKGWARMQGGISKQAMFD